MNRDVYIDVHKRSVVDEALSLMFSPLAKNRFFLTGRSWKSVTRSSSLRVRKNRVAGGLRPFLMSALLLVTVGVWADDGEAKQTFEFNIPQQSADLALTEFAEQADLTVAFPGELVRDRVANDLVGDYTLQEGVDILLAGTGLTPTFSSAIVLSISIEEPSVDEGEVMASSKKSTGLLAVLASLFTASLSPVTASAQADGEIVEELVVTGSRISRSSLSTPTPTVILGAEEIEAAGTVNIGDLLREVPAIGPGINAESTAATFSGAGLNLIDLRTLGTERTLVLVNGRRHVGSQPSSTAVDLNAIPAALIERVEIITGGASAVYGADAVSGVVNIILKDDFEGLQLDAQYGMSDRGDADRYQIGLTGGTNFADDAGNVVFHVSYADEGGIDFDATPGGRSGANYVDNPANTGPNDGIPDFIVMKNLRQVGGQQESAFIIDRGNGREAFGFNPDGTLRPFELGPSGLIGNTLLTDGGEAAIGFDSECPQAQCQLKVPVERFLMNGAVRYDVTDNIEAFFEGKFAMNQAESRIGSVFEIPPFTNQIPIDNPFVTDELRDLMTQAGVDSIGILRSDMELGPRGTNSDRRLFQMTVGARGDIGSSDNWNYETYFQYGDSRSTLVRLNDLFQNRFTLALDAVVDPADGEIKCRSVVEGTAQDPGCVPVNLLLGGQALTPEILDFVEIPSASETAQLQQLIWSGVVTGSIGDYWGAGAISVAGGVEWREEKSDFQTTGTQQAGLGFFNSLRPVVLGEFDVFEVFGEVVVPVLSDLPFAESLNVEGAVRYADYSTAGAATSWKLGSDWSPVEDVRFRVVRARAVRAPNIGELFNPGGQGFVTVDDPCDAAFVGGGAASRAANCAALGITQPFASNAQTINIRTQTSGNPDLEVETADTLTIGAVLTPRWIPDFSLTLDYFDIEIDDAINVLGTQQVLDNCVDLATTDNVFCRSVNRDAAGNILLVRNQNINVSNFIREGMDIEARYQFDFDNAGFLDLGLVATRILTSETVIAPGTITGGAVIDENGEIGRPEWRFRGNAAYHAGLFSVNATATFLSDQVADNQPANPEDNRATTGTGTFTLIDLSLQYEFSDQMRFSFGADNIFDEQPPGLPDTRIGGGGSFAGAEIYPVIGRFFYLGTRVNF